MRRRRDIYSCFLSVAVIAGTGIITKTELKCFYTAFLDVGKLGEQKILEITDSAFEALTSVRKSCNLYNDYQLFLLEE